MAMGKLVGDILTAPGCVADEVGEAATPHRCVATYGKAERHALLLPVTSQPPYGDGLPSNTRGGGLIKNKNLTTTIYLHKKVD